MQVKSILHLEYSQDVKLGPLCSVLIMRLTTVYVIL